LWLLEAVMSDFYEACFFCYEYEAAKEARRAFVEAVTVVSLCVTVYGFVAAFLKM
jgi:hypothetical protein